MSFSISELREIASFASWNFIGVSSAALREQGGNILINLFGGGPAVNAARGIAANVCGAVSAFMNNFMAAVNPQITKSYSAGNHDYMLQLVFRSARFSYYLLLLLGLPILINTHYVLYLWLNTVPSHVVTFTRLVLLFTMCESISNPLITVMLATGKIRNYQIVVGGLQMLNFPISYLMLRLGFFPEIVTMVAIFLSVCCLLARIYMLHRMISLPGLKFLRDVVGNLIVVTCASITLPMLFLIEKCEDFVDFMLSAVLCLLTTSLSVFFIGCNRREKEFICDAVISFFRKRIK